MMRRKITTLKLKLAGVAVCLALTVFHLCLYNFSLRLFHSNSNTNNTSGIDSSSSSSSGEEEELLLSSFPSSSSSSANQVLLNTTNNMKRTSTKKSSSSSLKVTYVTSYWAQQETQPDQSNKEKKKKSKQPHPHRKEIEAALLANINNPYFDQIVVLLDGISESSNCIHFIEHMKQLHQEIVVSSDLKNLFPSSHDQEDHHYDPFSNNRFNCINIYGGQPTYYEMFNYTLSEELNVTGDDNIVVMANADQAFDETISKIPYLLSEAHSHTDADTTTDGDNKDASSVFFVLSTRGFTDQIPDKLSKLYDDMTLDEEDNHKFYDPPVDRCYVKRLGNSWDTYIYKPKDIRGGRKIKEKDFKRKIQTGGSKAYKMNESGGENAALYDLTKRVIPNAIIYNGCKEINTWHFHWFDKMHDNNKDIDDEKDNNKSTTLWKYNPSYRVPPPAIWETKYITLSPNDREISIGGSSSSSSSTLQQQSHDEPPSTSEEEKQQQQQQQQQQQIVEEGSLFENGGGGDAVVAVDDDELSHDHHLHPVTQLLLQNPQKKVLYLNFGDKAGKHGLGSLVSVILLLYTYFGREILIIKEADLPVYRLNETMGPFTGFFQTTFPVLENNTELQLIQRQLLDLNNNNKNNNDTTTILWDAKKLSSSSVKKGPKDKGGKPIINKRIARIEMTDSADYIQMVYGARKVLCSNSRSILEYEGHNNPCHLPQIGPLFCNMFKFQPNIETSIQSHFINTLPDFTFENSVSFHLRRGDKITVERYFAANEYVQLFLSKVPSEAIAKIRHCFLASDDPTVKIEMQTALMEYNISCQLHTLFVVEDDDDDHDGDTANPTNNNNNTILPEYAKKLESTSTLRGIQSRTDVSSTMDFLYELYAMIHTTYFVGSGNSNVWRLAVMFRGCRSSSKPNDIDAHDDVPNFQNNFNSYGIGQGNFSVVGNAGQYIKSKTK